MVIDRQQLIQRVQEIEGLSEDERAGLLQLLREQKKYGIVWEDKPEEAEARLATELPVLIEDKDRYIPGATADALNHILIEGDNLHALTALSYTHEGKIDVIYIDPPYNTGNKDFVYNDSYVDREDGYRHSKWLSFMNKRLKIAKRLLSDRGVIFISIDDNEQAQLKMLCDEVFGEQNFIAQSVRKRRDSQANLSHNISPIHEYVFIYSKLGGDVLNKVSAKINEKDYKNPDNDLRGPYVTMPCTNKGGAIYTVTTPTGKSITEEWRFKIETYYELLKDNRLVFPRGGDGKPRYKLFLKEKKAEGVLANTWWDDVATNQQGTIELKKVLGELSFNNPKPVGLIDFCLKLGSARDSTILDFFAGSGTTLHATMQLNAEDGGRRQCILVTNNENGICENVTYERGRRVIQGYTTPKGVAVTGLTDNTLRYYRTDFVGRERTPRNMRRLMALATDMLCVKNNLYCEQDEFCGRRHNKQKIRYFTAQPQSSIVNSQIVNPAMLVIYDEQVIERIVELLKQEQSTGRIMVYVFAPDRYAYNELFEDIRTRVEPCALPAAIYDAYRNVLGRRKPKITTTQNKEEGGQNDD